MVGCYSLWAKKVLLKLICKVQEGVSTPFTHNNSIAIQLNSVTNYKQKSDYRNSLFFCLVKFSSKKYLRTEEIAGEKEMACCVRGHHICKDIWAAAIGEGLVCSKEPTNVGVFT